MEDDVVCGSEFLVLNEVVSFCAAHVVHYQDFIGCA